MAADFETLSKYLENGIFLMGINDYNALLTEAEENALESEHLHLERPVSSVNFRRGFTRNHKYKKI